jgi:hypothetical protein
MGLDHRQRTQGLDQRGQPSRRQVFVFEQRDRLVQVGARLLSVAEIRLGRHALRPGERNQAARGLEPQVAIGTRRVRQR